MQRTKAYGVTTRSGVAALATSGAQLPTMAKQQQRHGGGKTRCGCAQQQTA